MERVHRRKGRRHSGLDVRRRMARVLIVPTAWARPRQNARIAMPESDLASPGR